MAKSFIDLKLNNWIVRQCNAMDGQSIVHGDIDSVQNMCSSNNIGIRQPTPIQTNCIPHILFGGDCIGCAKTGSGKTLAFALPILQKLCEDPYGIFAIILTPTRELAFQISDTFSAIGKAINLRQCVIVGGMDMVTQGQMLARRPHVVIATPGRLADHLESCDTFSLRRIKFLVLDEADRLLSGAFDEQLQTIFGVLPKERQTLLFSATMTEALDTVKQVATNQVLLWEAEAEVATVDQLQQFYVLCPVTVKDSYLVETIRMFSALHSNPSIMIFTDTCKNCQLLSITLNEVGFDNVALHGMIPQKERLASLARFKSNTVRILVATDVASRGLDIPAVELVINHDMPSSPTTYIHRVGRTARAGRSGTAISLVTPHDIKLLQAVEAAINLKLEEFSVSGKEVAKIFTQVSVTKREAEIKLDHNDFEERKKINKRKKLILEGKDPDEEERRVLEGKKQKRKEMKLLMKKKLKQRQKEIKEFVQENSEKITKDVKR